MTTTYGRIKTKGHSTVKEFESPKAAKTAAEKLIAQKLKKGYTQTGGSKAGPKAKRARNKAPKKTTARKTTAKVPKSEQDARVLLEAAARLEAKYPVLKKLESSVGTIRPRYKAILKKIPAEKLDRRGSLIGGPPFLTEKYPAPWVWSEVAGETEKKLAMAPLLQLDLAVVSELAGERLGTGLLQLWMPEDGNWFPEPYLSQSGIRIVPRREVDRASALLDLPRRSADTKVQDDLAKMEQYKETDQKTYLHNRRHIISGYHYDEGTAGFDWTNSACAGEFDSFELEKTGAPLQIVGWKSDGLVIPPSSYSFGLDEETGLWNIHDDVMDQIPDSLLDDNDFNKVLDIVCETSVYSRRHCSLFDIYKDFESELFSDLESEPTRRSWLWRPLIAFRGPMSHPGGISRDDHVVFYRRKNRRVDFSHANIRWNY